MSYYYDETCREVKYFPDEDGPAKVLCEGPFILSTEQEYNAQCELDSINEALDSLSTALSIMREARDRAQARLTEAQKARPNQA